MADWKSGTLLGSGYAFVADGRALSVSSSKDNLRRMWEAATKAQGIPHEGAPFPEHLVKQICFVLPPWEKSDATD